MLHCPIHIGTLVELLKLSTMVSFMKGVVAIMVLFSDAGAVTLRGPSNATTKMLNKVPAHALPAVSAAKSKAPCACATGGSDWKACTRTKPRCVFIDLGAANGNTFEFFMKDGYGPIKNCPSGGEWAAVLVEANPRFNSELAAVGKQHPTAVEVKSATAAYMCEAHTSFFLDTVNTQRNFWGSSMSADHPDVQRSGKTKVTVPTINLNRVLYEETIPGDWVMVKMDIEGSEWDVLPCVAQSTSASLIDRLYLEQHDPSWGMIGTTPLQMDTAKNELRHQGVDIPDYFSQTL